MHFLGPYADVRRPVTLSPGWALLEGSPGYSGRSQPVFSNLVCDESKVCRDLCSAFQPVIEWVCQDLRFGGLYPIRGANCIFQQVEPLPITWTQLGALLGRCQPQGNHTFSAFWLRSSVVSVLISLCVQRVCQLGRKVPANLLNSHRARDRLLQLLVL